ncbi:hypothetical protein LLH06_14100 [Mucilaginibacter daejeonensis]|uniref:hypothetical protein n=1 Tax=Mucilaginibacter daejeonensis TaxID=398049 RepID=UPI001D172645|nr:hypothetical protein [Mucilaginibacter daejeonensis]UEG52094.1 hypothetical protein LLH06_14100 [Mucilaginibacter daejeonensis]
MMKKQLLYLLIGVASLSAGCMKDNDSDVTPVAAPQGSFSGQFIRIHLNRTTNKRDTIKLPIGLEMVNNTFKITGDTTKHAGSFGTFSYNSSYIQWVDATVPTGANALNLPKYHLHGIYLYAQDATKLQFQASNDTLLYFYDLTKATK